MAAPMIANKQLAQKLSTIARSWVIDPFRPNLQLKTFLESLAAHPRLTTQAVSAARSLRDNDITKKYPLSNKTLQPRSMPHHYGRLVQAFEQSAKGIRRPWWKVFFNIW
ncbi:hypothetical protein Agabi119p4_11482 [Agaricus bisporus var. burnettii]|uniref:Uncharacterized protein n=1 Tax=Agaricus bisporus var. burnettii TaxID=192524 RepID=A0A8H7BYQ0_AGABI|nr:hypothetical protein Agabi119p4_11482 [Agaricus bisporus var. burnettii]